MTTSLNDIQRVILHVRNKKNKTLSFVEGLQTGDKSVDEAKTELRKMLLETIELTEYFINKTTRKESIEFMQNSLDIHKKLLRELDQPDEIESKDIFSVLQKLKNKTF